MTNKRIQDHPVLGALPEQELVEFKLDDETYQGFKGDTIASALLANGIRHLRMHEASSTPRGIYCNIGHCFECRMTVDGTEGVRACITPIKQGMQIRRKQTLPNPLDPNTSVDNLPHTYAAYTSSQNSEKEGEQNV